MLRGMLHYYSVFLDHQLFDGLNLNTLIRGYKMKYFDIKNTILLIAAIPIALISSSCTSSDDAATTSTTATSTTSDDTTTTGTTTDTQSSVSTPANFATILSETISPTLTPTIKTSVANLDRVLIKYSSSYVHLDNSTYAVGINSTISTYNDVFLKTFQLISQSSEECYRLDSEKHSNWSLDYNTSTMRLELNDTFGYTRDTNSSYLCFTFPSMNTMKATKRYTFSTSNNSYSEDTSFSAKYVEYDTSNAWPELSSSSSAITVYDSGLDVAIPTGMNPSGASMVTNERVAWTSSNADNLSDHNFYGTKLYTDTHSSYQSQIAAAGDNASTATAAATMLSAIKTDLEAVGSSLRYTKAVYTAFRNALLKTTLTGETIVGGSVGQNTAPYVYFTNEKDDSGTMHPFMVIASYSIQDRPNRLLDVTTPPGDGSGGYGESKVTRDALLGSFLYKIPLKDYGEVSTVGDNVMTTDSSGDGQNLADDAGDINYNVYSWASINTVGIAVDGVEIYPLFNNVLLASVEKGEVTQSGIHVGQGMGLHWHGDGHAANGNKMNIYNLRDYVGYDHPPLIGFGNDGVALYGKYEDDYSSMDGFSTEIDDFGGHEHDGYNYHYHAHTMESSVLNALTGYGGSLSYTVAVLMKGAWAGLINDIPEFWNGDKPNGGSGNKYGGHKDYATYTP